MRLFITGATGFVGSWTLRHALERGHAVSFLQRPGADLWRIDDAASQAVAIVGTLDQPGSYINALKQFQPDAVLHLAWDGVGSTSRNDPKQADNVTATLALLENSASSGAGHFIGLGSQAEYGPCSNVIDEQQPTVPTTQYGIAKLQAGQQGAARAAALGVRFGWLRLFSSYGPKDNPDWLVSSLCLKLLKGEKPSLTLCEQKWDFIHVRDVASALISVAETPGAEGVFNLASGEAAALKNTVTYLRDLVDPSLPLGFGDVPYRPDQVMHLEGDIRRLGELADWKPSVALHDGLRETLSWYRANLGRYA